VPDVTMLSVIVLGAIVLGTIVLGAIMLRVVAPIQEILSIFDLPKMKKNDCVTIAIM